MINPIKGTTIIPEKTVKTNSSFKKKLGKIIIHVNIDLDKINFHITISSFLSTNNFLYEEIFSNS